MILLHLPDSTGIFLSAHEISMVSSFATIDAASGLVWLPYQRLTIYNAQMSTIRLLDGWYSLSIFLLPVTYLSPLDESR